MAWVLDRFNLLQKELEPIELASDLRLEIRRQRTAVAGLQRLETGPPITVRRLVVTDPLRKEETFDAVDMLHALGD
jgi:hypothetical protein